MEGNDLFLTIVVSCLTIFLVLSLVVALLVKSSIRQHNHQLELARAALVKDQAILRAEQHATKETLQQVGLELHDNVAQLLSLASLGLGSELARAPQNKVVTGAHEGVVQALAEVRRLSHTLNVDLWKDLSIEAAIGREAERVRDSTGLALTVQVEGALPALEPRQKMGLYRVFQEVLNNTVKHSGASQLIVTLSAAPVFTMRMADDGKGFDPHTIRSAGGLANIPGRCDRMGFDASCETAPGKGCTWRLVQRAVPG
ncbi:MAG TPA: histidine kinase [Flavobacteriales bacterium]|nr:histidine kinase [Flavobacteriales bacterium]HNU57638.1 histidine kinase [Flavobacteriales bacterium]